MKNPIAVSVLLVLSATCLLAADNALASDLEKINSDYRIHLENLQDRPEVASDPAIAKKIQSLLASLPNAPSTQPQDSPTDSSGNLAVNSTWQGNVNIKKDRDSVNYSAKAIILESSPSGFTINAKFLDRDWVYKFKKNAAGKLELASAEAKAGAGITKGLTKIYASSVEVVTETGKEAIRIHTVRKDANIIIDGTYDLRPEP